MTAILVVGTGRMGSALARCLLKAGHPTLVWNRSPDKCRALTEAGATVARSVADGIAAADIVIVNLLDYEASDATLRNPAVLAALPGKAVVQLTSGSPRAARDNAAWVTAAGAAYLDGAIMATPNFIGEPHAAILYSGDRSAFDGPQRILKTLAGDSRFVGTDPGIASALDSALLGQMWGTLFGTLQAIAITEAEAIGGDVYQAGLAAFQPVIDGAVADLYARARDGRYRGDDATLASLAAHHTAFRHLHDLARERGLNLTVANAFDGLFAAAQARGHHDDDFAALIPLMRAA